MILRKVQKNNSTGAVMVNIPAELAEKRGLVPGTYVNFEELDDDYIKFKKVNV